MKNKTAMQNESNVRKRLRAIKADQCKNLIAVLEAPNDVKNIGTVIRNIDALGVEKLYVIDSKGRLPNDWQQIRERKSLLASSVSAVKWRFVKVFPDTASCLAHLHHKRFTSVVTSPHIKGENNVVLHDGNYTQKRLAVWFGNEVAALATWP